MINRGPEKFGFMVLDLPNGLFARSTKFYLSILLSVIHPSGGARLKLLDQMNQQRPQKPVKQRERVREEDLSLEAEMPGATVVN
ncbi:hypothetical protein KC345_g10960 [Hortaea werneckii]|nr:hypothetical protein KC345_g10960 [Hortaea werneckii]